MALKNFTQFTPYTVLCATDFFVGYRQLDEIRTDWDSMIWEMSGGLIRKGFRVDLGDIPVLSGTWNSVYSTTRTNSANWGSTYNTVFANSAGWGADTSIFVKRGGDAMTGFLSAAALSARDFLWIDRVFVDSAGTTNLFVANSSLNIGTVTGTHNLTFGVSAGNNLTSGNNNTLIGHSAGRELVTGTDNVFIGNNAGLSARNNNNVAIGSNAGRSLGNAADNVIIGNTAGCVTTGNCNILLGFAAGALLRSGNSNTFIGGRNACTASLSGGQNVAIGFETGRDLRQDGCLNTFLGSAAGLAAQNACCNTYVGHQAGAGGANICDNTYIGVNAGRQNQGVSNVYIGIKTGNPNITKTASFNTVVGPYAGYNISTDANVVVGAFAGMNMTGAGTNNVFMGYAAGCQNTTGANNTYIGSSAGQCTLSGSGNTAIGKFALQTAAASCDNTAIGESAGFCLLEGCSNVFVGKNTGFNSKRGCDNIFIGAGAGSRMAENSPNANFNIAIGTSTGQCACDSFRNVLIGHRIFWDNSGCSSGNVIIGNLAHPFGTCRCENLGLGNDQCVLAGGAWFRNVWLGNGIQTNQVLGASGTVVIGTSALVDQSCTLYLGSAIVPLSVMPTQSLTSTVSSIVAKVNGSWVRIPLLAH